MQGQDSPNRSSEKAGLAGAGQDSLGLLVDGLPLLDQALDVGDQLLLTGALGGGAHDDARVVGERCA